MFSASDAAKMSTRTHIARAPILDAGFTHGKNIHFDRCLSTTGR